MTLDLTAALGQPGGPLAVSGWSIDTRTLLAGDAFFALSGPSHDGHDFVSEAARKGAAAVVVSRAVDAGVRSYLVEDPLSALQQTARRALDEWNGDVVAVTGSAGKTSAKDAVAHLLAGELPVGKTIGNFNNHVGVPLSILRLPDECRIAVLEMGMNHAGEIRELARLARPRVGVITNVGHAHIENFDSVDGIALAKRELIEELAPAGVAVLNADDERVSRFRDVHAGPIVSYGFSGRADVRADGYESGLDNSRFVVDAVRFDIPLPGRHNVMNVLAAIAVGKVYGIAVERLPERARSIVPAKMRGERLTVRGMTIWNDCYNANPAAMKAMTDVLAATPARRRIAVLGEMLELGHASHALHREVGRYVAASGIDLVVGVHGAAQWLAGETGGPFFETPEEAGDYVRAIAREGDAILFKGSRGVRVELALDRVVKE
ncbi:MAG: UDP-N-acetylmuramoyl-tripeptide--D-alanyl-D-alanine ligase [Bryobacteraceae bacterium]